MAAFLGYPDHSARADCYVLHDARTGALDWEGKGAADILRPDAYPASLNEALMAEGEEDARCPVIVFFLTTNMGPKSHSVPHYFFRS